MEKYVSLFLAILMMGFAQQVLAQDENATADENATSDENEREERWRVLRESSPGHASADDSERWSDFLPLMKDAAGDADLPLPFGIGVTGYWQEQDMQSRSISFKSDLTNMINALLAGTVAEQTAAAGIQALLGGNLIDTTADATNVESEVDNYNIRLDAWLMPFLNIYGVYGEVDGENTASGLALDAATTTVLTTAGLSVDPFKFSYDGNVYGFGIILAGQLGKYWGTVDYNFTQADLDISTSEIDTHTITPRIGTSGTMGSLKGSLWIGAMHQRIDEVQAGSISVSGLDIDYNVLLEQENEWNFLIGGAAELSKQWNASIEGGLGNRKQVMGNLTFRF